MGRSVDPWLLVPLGVVGVETGEGFGLGRGLINEVLIEHWGLVEIRWVVIWVKMLGRVISTQVSLVQLLANQRVVEGNFVGQDFLGYSFVEVQRVALG